MRRSPQGFLVILLVWAAVAVVLIAVVVKGVDLGNDFRERCEAAGGKPVSMHSGLECMKKEQFVEVGDE